MRYRFPTFSVFSEKVKIDECLFFIQNRVVLRLKADDFIVGNGEGDEDVGTDRAVVSDDGIPT